MVNSRLQKRILRQLRKAYPDHLNPADNKFRQDPDYDASLWDLAEKGLIQGVNITRTISGKASYTEGNLTLTDKGWDRLNQWKNWLKDHAHHLAIALGTIILALVEAKRLF